MSERLEMRPGFPPFDWWVFPPDEVLLSVYVFNITNGENFLNGETNRLSLSEVGPIIYREKLTHTNVQYNDNDTLTYTATRRAVYLPELNSIDLDQNITVANLAVLGISSYLWNAPWALKFGFNMLLKRHKSQPLKQMTIRQYLWDYEDPIVNLAKSLAPSLVPTENIGVLEQIYSDFVDRITVYIGRKWGNFNYFKVNKFNGNDGLNKWKNRSCDSVEGSTEGVLYHQDIKKTDQVRYLRKTFCRAPFLHYTGVHKMLGMTIYKFELPNNTYDHPSDGEDCYLTSGLPPLPSGLTDASPCFYDFPIATSFPHMMFADPVAFERLDGLEPNPEKHGSYVYVEPKTGIPLKSAARSQSNLVIRPFSSGSPHLNKFKDLTIPMFWAEYRQVDLPLKVKALVLLTAKILPVGQYIVSLLFLVLCIFLLYKSIRRYQMQSMIQQSRVVYSSLLKCESSKNQDSNC